MQEFLKSGRILWAIGFWTTKVSPLFKSPARDIENNIINKSDGYGFWATLLDACMNRLSVADPISQEIKQKLKSRLTNPIKSTSNPYGDLYKNFLLFLKNDILGNGGELHLTEDQIPYCKTPQRLAELISWLNNTQEQYSHFLETQKDIDLPEPLQQRLSNKK